MEKLQEYQFTIVHRPGHRHNNADALSRVPCQQCGRSDATPVETITSANTTGGLSMDEMRQLQLDDNTIRPFLRAKETNEKPTDSYVKAQSIEYRRISQQWDQLAIQDGVLWQHLIHPRLDQSWVQLVAPKQIRYSRGTSPGDRKWASSTRKTLDRLKERFDWPGHFSDVHNWCESCVSCATRKTF